MNADPVLSIGVTFLVILLKSDLCRTGGVIRPCGQGRKCKIPNINTDGETLLSNHCLGRGKSVNSVSPPLSFAALRHEPRFSTIH